MRHFRQAIVVKYLSPTNHRGTRLKACATALSMTTDWRHELNVEDNMEAAARALATRLQWTRERLIGGVLPSGDYAFVFDPGSDDAV